MEKDVAKRIISNCIKAGENLHNVALELDKITDEEEKNRYKKKIAKLLADVYLEVMRPVINDYPELDPL